MRKKHLVTALLAIVCIMFLYSLIHRIPDIDDSWDGDFAYWQAKLGYVKSELMHGRGMQEVRLICHHKLLTLEGAAVIRVAGFSLYTLKSISLVFFLLFLFLYFKHTYKKLFPPFYFYLSLLILISNALIFNFAFVFRPEIGLMTLGFISYLLLDQVLKNNKGMLYIILSGLAAGLGVATHLNGTMFILAGGLLLFINRKYLYGIVFGLSSLPTAAIYFYDFTSTYNLNFWSYQIKELASLDELSNFPAGISQIMNLLTEHLRFFHSPKEVSFSLLFIFVVIFAFRHLKSQKNLLIYTLVLIITLGLISVSKASKYAIAYLPYLIIIIVSSVKYIFEERDFKSLGNKKTIRILTVFFIALYLSVNSYYNIKLCLVKFSPSDNRQLVTRYITEKTGNLRIVAPMSIIFNEIENFKSIQSDMCYSDMQKKDKTIYGTGFLQSTEKFETDYIILTEEFINKFGMNDFPDTNFTANGWLVITRNTDLLILRNISRNNQRNQKQGTRNH
jgi:hypothetical protein